MSALFGPRSNFVVRLSLSTAAISVVLVVTLFMALPHSSYNTLVGVELEQPIPFSHQHHVSGLGIDCRYCHTSVEESSFAGMPTTETCMSCHAKLYVDAPMLAPLQESWRTDMALQWRRVEDLPDFAYFDHAIHVQKGVACYTCHGAVDEMPITRRSEAMFMEWCIDCHREPEAKARDGWQRWRREGGPLIPLVMDPPAVEAISRDGLTNCSTCHR